MADGEPPAKKARSSDLPAGLAMFDLTGKIAVVTGGTGVLGTEMCTGLAAAGATVCVVGRRAEVAQQVVDTITTAGGKGLALPADVTDRASLEAAVAKLKEAYGTIDILVNAAGGNQGGATIQPDASFCDAFSTDAFDQITKLNLVGTILPCQLFGKIMEEKKAGIIVNISSMAAQSIITRVCGYSASKAAIDNFTKWLAVELAQKLGDKIRVNAIAPGFFLAEQNRKLLTNEDGSLTARGDKIITKTPFGRFGDAKELVGPLIMLCSSSSSFITGTVVNVDGGFGCFSGV